MVLCRKRKQANQKETPDRKPVRGELVEAAGQLFRIFRCRLDYAFIRLHCIGCGACYPLPDPSARSLASASL